MAKINDRTYDSSDIKELMDNTYDWAKSWDDVLWYIQNIASYDADFAKDEIEPLKEDVEKVKKENRSFTYDYRQIFEYITGKTCEDCPPPEGLKSHDINPKELADKWLKNLDFPASKDQAASLAQKNNAPEKVTMILHKIEDKEYQNIGSLLEAVGDKTWDHD